MSTLSKQIVSQFNSLPEGSPLCAKELLHLGTRAAVDQALARLVRRGKLLRASRGIYVLPVEGSYGKRAPSAEKVAQGLSAQSGETIVANGAVAANSLGLTTQVPIRQIYLTSGRSRKLKLGSQIVEFRHAPSWQLLHPGHAEGEVVRALAWLGPERAKQAVPALHGALNSSELQSIAKTRSQLPGWMAQEVSRLVAYA